MSDSRGAGTRSSVCCRRVRADPSLTHAWFQWTGHAIPVVPVDFDGKRSLVAPYGVAVRHDARAGRVTLQHGRTRQE